MTMNKSVIPNIRFGDDRTFELSYADINLKPAPFISSL